MSDFTISMTGNERLAQAFAQAPAQMRRQMLFAMDAATARVQIYAQAKHRFISRSGRLEASITRPTVTPELGIIGLDLSGTKTEQGSYGVFVHQGTRAHEIRPRQKRILRWPTADGFAFAKRVMHPGTRPDPFLAQAGRANRLWILSRFGRATSTALKEAGL